MNWNYLWISTGLNVLFLAVAGCLFVWILNLTRKRGLLTKFATQ
jgi:ABC-2 type transport system permease protein